MFIRSKTAALAAVLALLCPLHAQDTKPGESPEGKPHEAPPIKVTTPQGSASERVATPESVTILDQRQVEERHVGQAPDLLDGATGVFVQHTAAGQGSPFVRGLTGKQIVVLVNGVRFNNSIFRAGPNQYFSSLDGHNIVRIEVVRGPSSVLYGSDAQGGVINVFTRKPAVDVFDYTFGTRARYASASNERRGNIFGAVGGSGFGALASATYSDVDLLNGGAGVGRQPKTDYEEWGAYGAASARFGKHRIDFTYSHFEQINLNRTDAVTTWVANPSLLPGGGTQSREIQNLFVKQGDDLAILRWEWTLGTLLEQFHVNASYHRVQEDLLRTPRSATPTRRNQGFNVHTFGLSALAVLNFGEWSRVSVGGEVYHDIVHSRRSDQNLVTGAVTSNPRLDDRGQFPDWSLYSSFGVYAQDEIRLADDLLLIRPGVRYSGFRAQADLDKSFSSLDGVNEYYGDLTGALAFLIRPIDEFSIGVNLARGFRAPNLDDLAASKGTGAGNEIPNPDLEPEDQWSTELSVKGYVPTRSPESAAPHWISGNAAVFFSYFDNAFRRINTTFNGSGVVQFDNSGRYRIYGFEAEVSWFIGPELGLFGLPADHIFFEGDALGIIANFTWTRGDDIKNDEPVSRIPPLMTEVALRYEAMRGKVYVEPYLQFVGRQDQLASGNKGDVRFTPHDEASYVLFGLRAGWYPVRNFNLNLNIQNIGNRAYHGLGNGTFGPGTNVILSAELKW